MQYLWFSPKTSGKSLEVLQKNKKFNVLLLKFKNVKTYYSSDLFSFVQEFFVQNTGPYFLDYFGKQDSFMHN